MTEQMIPMIIVPLSFLFVLLIILVVKAPKLGAWVIGGLVLLAPVLLYRCAMAGGFRNDEGVIIPLVVVPAAFLFVLMIILLNKAPKAGAGLLVALVVMGVFAVLVLPGLSHRAARVQSTAVVIEVPTPQPPPVLVRSQPPAVSPVWQSGGVETLSLWVKIVLGVTPFIIVLIVLLVKAPKVGVGLLVALAALAVLLIPVLSHRAAHVRPVTELIEVPAPQLPSIPVPPKPVVMSPIWSEGMEKEFAADVYPSQLVAVRVLGSRVNKPIRELAGDAHAPQITLFQEDHDRALIVEFKNALQQALPQASCSIEAELRNIRPNEVGITLGLPGMDMQAAPWAKSPETKMASGRVEAHVFNAGGRQVIGTQFVEKPWVENFAAFTSNRPEQAFIVTRSQGTCTSESEAHQQALDDTRARLTAALGRRPEWRRGGLPEPAITSTDVLQGGFIVDRFTQSFEGSAGKIWRQALLIDVAGPKLSQLAGQKARELHAQKMSWARMGFSVLGVLVLIGVIYFFLNIATLGYYEWSLRIAGIVLAVVAIISILMVVQ